MRHIYRCALRWSDMDAFGHVNNVVFLRYLEEARIEFFFRLAREASADAFTGGSVVARHEIDYLKPLVHRQEPVTIDVWVIKIGAASATVGYEVKDGETVYARASTVIVPYDLERARPRRLTAAERTFLEKYGDDAAGSPVPS
ncbi:acyl-CoA thioesterase [Streptomyces radicis]|uniref:Acyl-CoA thioesterase n=1 Tax=Streptomyces radicis TaxID=1750517 RepID=A0A3A9VUS7_9ACTN|nr:thioesterase family protein [Streptomyces radicis]RKN04841.1 acyl-CoA thioesterase [Streptomyces radicis]RKN25351.1 acyl-CoA thioesterase [Streptomyces radicis]